MIKISEQSNISMSSNYSHRISLKTAYPSIPSLQNMDRLNAALSVVLSHQADESLNGNIINGTR